MIIKVLQHCRRRTCLSALWQSGRRSLSQSSSLLQDKTLGSTSENSVIEKNISKNFYLRSLNPENNSTKKDLVVIFDWLYAPKKAVIKYCDLYHQKGHDVIVVKGRLVHFLWPPWGYILSEELLSYLVSSSYHDRGYLIHAFSVGAYLYSISLSLTRRKPELFSKFREKVKGQIFDSIVLGSYDHMSTGIALALPGSKLMTKPTLELMDVYYSLTKKTTRDEYDRLVDLFKSDPITVPTLLYYSHDDPMCHVPSMNEMLDKWRADFPNFDVTAVSWEKSTHAAHLKFHPESYMTAFNEYYRKTQNE